MTAVINLLVMQYEKGRITLDMVGNNFGIKDKLIAKLKEEGLLEDE